MAPEQIYQLPPDPRIDIYATGILLYEMIVGSRPFSGPDMATVVKMQLSTPPKPPRQVLGLQAISEELEQVIMKSLEKDRVDRFGTASEMANALRATPEGRVVTGATETTSRSRSTAPLRRASVALLGVGAVFALGVVGVSMFSKPPVPHSELTSTSASQVPPPSPPPMAAPAAVPEPEPAVAAAPPAMPAMPAWREHRDKAIEFARQGERDQVLREVASAIEADPSAAGTDPELTAAAVSAVDRAHLATILKAFRSSPQLAAALAQTTADGATAEQRHAAYEGLRKLGEQSKADTVAMQIRDVEQAAACPAVRNAFKPLRASADPRAQTFKADLRARGRRDKHFKCLKRMLGR
jgi:serine/threonine-protein kinase